MFFILCFSFFFFFNDTATTEIYTLSLHDALPICCWRNAFHGSGFPRCRTRPPTVALASPQARGPAHHAGQPTARAGHESGAVPQEEAVHQERSRGTGELGPRSVGPPTARGTSEAARPTRSSDRRVGPLGSGRSRAPRRCGSTDDPSRHRTRHFVGVRAGHRYGDALLLQPKTGELSWIESDGGIQRRPAAVRGHQQTGQHHGALAADRNGTPRRAAGSRAKAGLSAVEVPKRTRGGQGGHRAQVGCAYVLDAA